MATLKEIRLQAIEPAFKLLPAKINSPEALVMMYAIGLQESRFEHRYQVVQGKPGAKGPARSYWQFEEGTEKSRGGVWGIYLHPASRELLREACKKLGVDFTPKSIWLSIENNDVLATVCARLLLYTDAYKLPALGSVDGAWDLYALRTWRPGKPHRQTWNRFYSQALEEVRHPS